MQKTLFEMAKSWINVPFRWKGITRNGCDCVGLVIGILYENNILTEKDLIEIKNIRFGTNLVKIDKNKMFSILFKYFDRTDKIEEADLFLIKTKNSPIHFEIYNRKASIHNTKIIHITKEVGCVFETNLNNNFEKNINLMLKMKNNLILH